MGTLSDSSSKISEGRLAEKIEKAFRRYKVNMEITSWYTSIERVIFEVKLKGETRKEQLLARVSDVQLRLKLPVFQAVTERFTIYIIVSDQEIVYDHLPQIFCSSQYMDACKKMFLPYVVGFDSIGRLIIVDLSKMPHLLVAGATNSGKTVGLQALIASIIYGKRPSRVNLILIDVGASDLLPFERVPHLSCPVIRERNSACQALEKLRTEMERRINVQSSDNESFKKLPRLVLVIDEFPALFVGVEDRRMVKLMTDAVSALLQRGQHAKIHVVLAAQNPAMQNMKVDLGNITGRIAFKCAKKNFSETILGESGAENLLGKGDMYFKSPEFSELKRIQGTYITPNELSRVIQVIKTQSFRFSIGKYKINLSDNSSMDFGNDLEVDLIVNPNHSKQDADERMFAKIMIWALGRNEVSGNAIMRAFGYGWNRASHVIDRLYEFGVVGDLDAKLPRKVIPQSMDEVSDKAKELLQRCGCSEDIVTETIRNRDNG
ncbi:MAG: hypothetical protein K2I53_05975 [Lachnospiraceae bacterium]|nr:hypothetical protein [Lachnospiraceae bacterium]